MACAPSRLAYDFFIPIHIRFGWCPALRTVEKPEWRLTEQKFGIYSLFRHSQGEVRQPCCPCHAQFGEQYSEEIGATTGNLFTRQSRHPFTAVRLVPLGPHGAETLSYFGAHEMLKNKAISLVSAAIHNVRLLPPKPRS